MRVCFLWIVAPLLCARLKENGGQECRKCAGVMCLCVCEHVYVHVQLLSNNAKCLKINQ